MFSNFCFPVLGATPAATGLTPGGVRGCILLLCPQPLLLFFLGCGGWAIPGGAQGLFLAGCGEPHGGSQGPARTSCMQLSALPAVLPLRPPFRVDSPLFMGWLVSWELESGHPHVVPMRCLQADARPLGGPRTDPHTGRDWPRRTVVPAGGGRGGTAGACARPSPVLVATCSRLQLIPPRCPWGLRPGPRERGHTAGPATFCPAL